MQVRHSESEATSWEYDNYGRNESLSPLITRSLLLATLVAALTKFTNEVILPNFISANTGSFEGSFIGTMMQLRDMIVYNHKKLNLPEEGITEVRSHEERSNELNLTVLGQSAPRLRCLQH